MIWTIGAVLLALIMVVVTIINLYVMKYVKTEVVDDDPVWQTVVAVDCLADEIARWETNLWSLWALAVVESLLFRLDKADRLPYLHKLENQIINLQQELYKSEPKSGKEIDFPYFEE